MFTVPAAARGATAVAQDARRQEEQSYFRFVEDISKYASRSAANHPLLIVVRSLLHKNFMPLSLQTALLKGLEQFTSQVLELNPLNAHQVEFHNHLVRSINEKVFVKPVEAKK